MTASLIISVINLIFIVLMAIDIKSHGRRIDKLERERDKKID